MNGRSDSIHPRVDGKRAIWPKHNTSLPKLQKTINKVVAAIEKHLEKHPRDSRSSARLAKLSKLTGA